jgi:hypothetical protein
VRLAEPGQVWCRRCLDTVEQRDDACDLTDDEFDAREQRALRDAHDGPLRVVRGRVVCCACGAKVHP